VTAPVSPKIELHVHLEGAVRPATLLAIAQRNGQPLPADTVDELASLYTFTGSAHFLSIWALTTNCLRTVDDFRQVVVDYAAEAARFGAVYIEATFSPCERIHLGITWDDLFTGYADGVVEAFERSGVIVRLTPDLHREVDADVAEQCARVAVRYRDRGVVGLGGRIGVPAGPFRRAWDIARDGGLGLVPHAGQVAGPDAIRQGLAIRPARIGHGIRAVEDPDLMAELTARGVVLDVCLSSNIRLAEVPSAAAHPLPRLRAAGVLCTINTDDPAMLDTDLGHEYDIAAALGMTAADAYAAGWAGMLCDDATRARLPAPARRPHPGSPHIEGATGPGSAT
jgi:aminodeoxyfutalosine deaminase